jgi:ribulose-phosphate 3-epimerase
VLLLRIKISPSILASNFLALGEECRRMESAGADMLHIDVMDGRFVPNITIGAPVISQIRRATSLPLDVHLMIEEPEKLLDDFIAAGADIITVHLEAAGDISGIFSRLKEAGVKAAVSIKPAASAQSVFPLLGDADMVLVMTVEPGFGGQELIESALEKVSEIRDERDRLGLLTEIQVDGGIKPSNINLAAKAGANIFVAGSAIFNSEDPAKTIRLLRENARK